MNLISLEEGAESSGEAVKVFRVNARLKLHDRQVFIGERVAAGHVDLLAKRGMGHTFHTKPLGRNGFGSTSQFATAEMELVFTVGGEGALWTESSRASAVVVLIGGVRCSALPSKTEMGR
jgi:hypothetical protein